jgi:hypothetical protein
MSTDLHLHNVSQITISNIREYPDYSTRTITIQTNDGEVSVVVYSKKDSDEDILKISI